MNTHDIIRIDRDHIWHPYTQHKTARDPIVLSHAKGASLYDTAGTRYIDGISSWWANPFGHARPEVRRALKRQVKTLDHVLFADVAHRPASTLAEKLLPHLPENQNRIFFSDNGSTAIESALKMSWQYFYNQGAQNRTRIVAFEEGFHGDTFAAMSVSGNTLFTEAFRHMLPDVVRLPLPNEHNIEDLLHRIDRLIDTGNICAFVFEPLIQGAAGMRMYRAAYLDRILERFQAAGIITIADEVMTGFGKTGKFLAVDHLTKKPDIICLSKALTAGVLPMAVTSCSEQIFEAFYDKRSSQAFFHGHTFTANPIGCAVAAAALDMMSDEKTQAGIERIRRRHRDFCKTLEAHPKATNIRALGTVVAFDFASRKESSYYGALRNTLYAYYLNHKAWLRPLGNCVYLMPPYIISDQDLSHLYDTVLKSLEEVF